MATASDRESDDDRRICLITRRSLYRLPPVMHQATLLAEAGYSVDLVGPVLDRSFTQDGTSLRGTNVHPIIAGVKRTRRTSTLNFIRYMARASTLARRRRYKAFWRYDYFRFYIAHRLAKKHAEARLVFHQNEVFEPQTLRAGARWLFNCHLRHINEVDLAIFPDKNRASFFRQQSGLTAESHIVGNFPLLLPDHELATATPQRVRRLFPRRDAAAASLCPVIGIGATVSLPRDCRCGDAPRAGRRRIRLDWNPGGRHARGDRGSGPHCRRW